VDGTSNFVAPGLIGHPVDVVLYDDGETHLIKTEVVEATPLLLRILGKSRAGVRAGRRVMLLAHYDGFALRADCHLNQLRVEEDVALLEIGNINWEILERRRHIRVLVSVPVVLRTVHQGNSEPEVRTLEGTATDMSISGAFVQIEGFVDEGALIEFSAEINGQTIRTLAVVARTVSSGIGIQFVEYLDNARHLLHGFLTRAA